MRSWRKNELELVLLGCERAVKKLLEDNPKSGIITDKGEETESKLRYTDVLKGIQRLTNHFGHIGARSMGICDTCTFYNRNGVSSVADSFGKCSNPEGKKADLIHCYDSCNYHSIEGAGYGKV